MGKITLIADSVCVEYSSIRTKVEVELSGVDIDDAISQIEDNEILESIGAEKVAAWFKGLGYEVDYE